MEMRNRYLELAVHKHLQLQSEGKPSVKCETSPNHRKPSNNVRVDLSPYYIPQVHKLYNKFMFMWKYFP